MSKCYDLPSSKKGIYPPLTYADLAQQESQLAWLELRDRLADVRAIVDRGVRPAKQLKPCPNCRQKIIHHPEAKPQPCTWCGWTWSEEH